jgi:hypothetical protein
MSRLATAAVLVVLGTAGALSARAADPAHPVDACALLTADDVAVIVGAKVEPGQRNDSGEVTGGGVSATCVWKVAGAPVASAAPEAPFGGARFAMLNTITWPAGSGLAHKYVMDFYQAAKDDLIPGTPVPVAVGDEGLCWGDGVASRKGDVSFGMSVHVGTDKAGERAMEEALAKKVAAKL